MDIYKHIADILAISRDGEDPSMINLQKAIVKLAEFHFLLPFILNYNMRRASTSGHVLSSPAFLHERAVLKMPWKKLRGSMVFSNLCSLRRGKVL